MSHRWGAWGGNLPGGKKHEVQRPSCALRCFDEELRAVSCVSLQGWDGSQAGPRGRGTGPYEGHSEPLVDKSFSTTSGDTVAGARPSTQGNGPMGLEPEDASPKEAPAAVARRGPTAYYSLHSETNANVLNPGGSTEEGSGILGSNRRACQGRKSEATEVPAWWNRQAQSRLHNVWNNLICHN